MKTMGVGSSPLTRGKQLGSKRRTRDRRLIPTHAGKTLLIMACNGSYTGSSPLTRGKRLNRSLAKEVHGLIPTHAGKTAGCRGSGDPTPAHPHSRGENFGPRVRVRVGIGSSPLTRGKPGGRRTATFTVGLIPTHAGKTPVSFARPLNARRLIPTHAGKTSSAQPT